MDDADLLASTPVFALVRRDSALRARISADWADAGVSHVRFVDALYPTDPLDSTHACVAAHDVSSVGCPGVRAVMQKRVNQACSQVWRLQSAVLCAGAPAAIVLEDDALLRPNRTAFRALLPRLLRELHARQAGGRRWDVAFLGSCFEPLHEVSSCEEVRATRAGAECAGVAADSPYRLWLSRAVGPLCMHGLVLTPRAAHLLHRAMSKWLARYHANVMRYYANSTSDPGAATCEGARWTKGMAFAILAHDVALLKAIRKRTLRGLHAWPQLVEQASKVEPRWPLARHKHYNYMNGMPAVCATAPRPRCRPL